MTKLLVLYPSGEGKSFDMDYYCNKHIPMVAGLLGDSVKGASVEKGLAGGAPNSASPYLATSSLYFDSVGAYEKSFGPNAEKIMVDIPNFTNVEPVIVVSEVVV